MINTGTATPRLDLLGPILLEGFKADAYVAHRVLPPLVVAKKTGAIPSFLFTNDQVLSIKRAPKTGFPRVISQLGEKTFSCQEDGVEEPLSIEDYEIMGRDGAEKAVANRLMHIVLRARDNALSAAWFSAAGETLFSGQVTTAAATWTNASGDPFSNIADAKEGVLKRTGLPANKLLIGYGAYTSLVKNAKVQTQLRQILGYTDKTGIKLELDPNLLANVFGVDEVIIGGGVANTAAEGQTASRSFIWPSTYAMVFRGSAGADTAQETSLGRTFTYDAATTLGSLAAGAPDALRSLMLEQYRDEAVTADIFRCRDYVDTKVLVTEAAQLIKSI